MAERKTLTGDVTKAARYIGVASTFLAQCRALGLPVLRRSLPGVRIEVKPNSWGDTIRIHADGGIAPDLYILEDLGRSVVVYGYDLKRQRLEPVAALDLDALTDLDLSLLTEEEIKTGLHAHIKNKVACFVKDGRQDFNGNPSEGLWKGVVGEGRLKKSSWLWESPAKHVSTNSHVTRGGLEFRYGSVQEESLAGVNANIECKWYWRDLNDPKVPGGEKPTFKTLFDLTASGAQSQVMFPETELLWLPISYDNPSYCLVSDTTIYMRIAPFFYNGATSAHEWWTLWRPDNGDGTYGEWGLYYDGYWTEDREDGTTWIFQEFITDPKGEVSGYCELKSHSDTERFTVFRFWFGAMGSSMSSEMGVLDLDIFELLGVSRDDEYTRSRAQCWLLDEEDTQAYLFKNTNVTHPATFVADGLFLRTAGVLEAVYLPAEGRRFGDYVTRTSRNGRYLLCVEEDRNNPSSSTMDILLIDLKTKRKKVLNRTAAYKKLLGKNIIYPFAFTDPGRTDKDLI